MTVCRIRHCLLMPLIALLFGCAGGPPTPDWQVNASGSLERAGDAYLEGNDRVAAVEFARARSELARTGKPALVARAELTRCAVRVASLDFEDCPAFAPLAIDAGAELRAYARYLAGTSQAEDVALLPAHHRATAADTATAASLAAIADPLSRLVAAAVALRRGKADAGIADVAVAAAEQNGWRRPLLAWLTLQHKAAETAQDGDTAARLRRRIELLAPAPAGEGASVR